MTDKMSVRKILRNATPAVAVMVAGVIGAYFVYNGYFSDRVNASYVAGIEPAAGEQDGAYMDIEAMPESGYEATMEWLDDVAEDGAYAPEDAMEAAEDYFEDHEGHEDHEAHDDHEGHDEADEHEHDHAE